MPVDISGPVFVVMEKTFLTSDILLFGAQGASPDVSGALLLDNIRDYGDDETKQLVNDFLQGCFEAFHSELGKLGDHEARALEQSVWTKLDTPETLVTCPPECQSNAVVECVTFYVHQTLDLIAYMSQATCHDGGDATPSQAAGVCSGILPAVLAASTFPCGLSSHFVRQAVGVFRVAFWIGVRSSLACWTCVVPGGEDWEGNNDAWALSVRGCVPSQLQGWVDDYNNGTSVCIQDRLNVIIVIFGGKEGENSY